MDLSMNTYSFHLNRRIKTNHDTTLPGTVNLVLISSKPLRCVHRHNPHIFFIGGLHGVDDDYTSVISISNRAFATVGDATGIVICTLASIQNRRGEKNWSDKTFFILSVVRTQRGYKWYSHRIDRINSEQSLYTALSTLQQNQNVLALADDMSRQCVFMPQATYPESEIAVAFVIPKSCDELTLNGGYYNDGLVEQHQHSGCCTIQLFNLPVSTTISIKNLST
jgi:hypothetical protein